jgi:S-formylglutathione hydrolase FrmB
VNVLLPDGYDPRRRYPVLYLMHGHGDSYWSWFAAKNGDLLNTARGFPGIVVMPEGGQGWYADWWNGGKRAEPAWERYYLDELMPLIEKRFRIRKGRRWHAIAGLSMGAEGATYFAEQRPGWFGAVASFSGPLSIQRAEYAGGGMDTQGQKFTDVFGEPDGFYATAHNPMANTVSLAHTRAYVAVGNGVGKLDEVSNYFGAVAEADLKQHAEDFVAASKLYDVDLTYAPRNGIHDWPYWRADLANAIKWGFFKPVPEKPGRWTVRSAAQRGEAWGFRWSLAAPPKELTTLRKYGNRLAVTGSGTMRIRTPAGARLTSRLPFTRIIPKRKRR